MFNIISISFVLLPIIFFFKIKNINHFLLFGVIFFNVFIFKGYGIIDEFFLFLSLVWIFYYEFKNKSLTIINLKKDLYISLKSLKNNYLNLVIFILFIYYMLLSIEGALIYDYRIVRYFLFFTLILVYLLYSDKFNLNKLNLNDCVFITRVSILTFFLYFLQGLLLEIFSPTYLSRYGLQGNLVAGSSAAFSILFFTTIPAIKIYKYKPITTSIYLIILLLNIQFFDSRVGTVVLFVLIAINFYKKIHIAFLCFAIATLVNVFLEFSSYLIKYDIKYEESKNICLNKSYKPDQEKFLNLIKVTDTRIINESCDFIEGQNRVIYALERLDRKYWQSREVINKTMIRYLFYKIDETKYKFDTIEKESDNQLKLIRLKNLNDEICKLKRALLNKTLNKSDRDKLIKEIEICSNVKEISLLTEKIKTEDPSEIESILNIKTILNLSESATIKVFKDSTKGVLKENIIFNPSLSDYDRMLPVVASINLILSNDNFFKSLFGYGFYSHKTELVKPIKNLLTNDKNFFKAYNDRYLYLTVVKAPVRTSNLPAIITDGGIFIIILYFLIFLLIAIKIIKNFKIRNLQSFLNKSVIIGFIFFLNYINFNLDNVFMYLILINLNHFTEFQIDG